MPSLMYSTIFDDSSPFIVYSPPDAWRSEGQEQEFNETSSVCDTPGSAATLTFYGTHLIFWLHKIIAKSLLGTSITVVGTIGSVFNTLGLTVPAPMSLYSIDNGPPTAYQVNEFQNTTQFGVNFFQATNLSLNTSHTLVVTLNNNGTFILDYIQVDFNASLAQGISPTGNISSSLATSGGLSASSSLPLNSSNSGLPLEGDDHPGRITIPQVIGATIGVVSFVAILLVCITYLVIRRRSIIRNRETSAIQYLNPWQLM